MVYYVCITFINKNLTSKGLVSLVTGGASGLGKATVERLVQNGGKVVILDIQGTRAQEVAKLLGEDVHVTVGCVGKIFL